MKKSLSTILASIMLLSLLPSSVSAGNTAEQPVVIGDSISESNDALYPLMQNDDGSLSESKAPIIEVGSEFEIENHVNPCTDNSSLSIPEIPTEESSDDEIKLMLNVSVTVYCRRKITIYGSSSNKVKLYRSATATTQVDPGWDCFARTVEIETIGFVNFSDRQGSRFFFYAKHGQTGETHLYYVDFFTGNVTEDAIYHTHSYTTHSGGYHYSVCDCGVKYNGSSAYSYSTHSNGYHYDVCHCGANYNTSSAYSYSTHSGSYHYDVCHCGSYYNSYYSNSCYSCYPAHIYYRNPSYYDYSSYYNGPTTVTLESSSATITSTLPTRFSWKFRGWSTSDSSSNGSYDPGDTIYLDPGEVLYLYPTWQECTYLSGNYDTGSTYMELKDTMGYFKFSPSESGTYVFKTTNSSGDPDIYLYSSSGTELTKANLSGNDAISYYLSSGKTYYYGVELYNDANDYIYVEVRRQYDISYDANGGSGAPSAQTKLHGNSITLSNTKPVKNLWKFKGWATSSTATSAQYQAGNSYSNDGDQTLYAVWGYPTGSCGSSATWTFSPDNKSLTISGSGAMSDFSGSTPAPWATYSDYINTISISDGITSIGNYAFSGCNKVAEINLPSSVTDIGEYAFSGCSALSTINIPSGVTAIEAYTFNNCATLIAPQLPETVTSIGEHAFSGCSSITSMILPFSVASIGAYAFSGCSDIESINIPSGITTIEAYTFNGNVKLNAIVIPDTVTLIKEFAFADCSSISSVIIPKSVTEIKNGAFSNCTSLTTATIPESVSAIGTNIFAYVKDNVTIKCYLDTVAHNYATNNGIAYELMSWGSLEGPTFSKTAIAGGVSVSITAPKGTIYYTTDGTEPTITDENLYNGPIAAKKNMTIKAVAVADGWDNSTVAEFYTDIQKVAIPLANIPSGKVVPGTKIELSCETEDTEIWYTTDGNMPTESGIYTGEIEITEDTTIYAIAVKDGMLNSGLAMYNYIASADADSATLTVTATDCTAGEQILANVNLSEASSAIAGSFEIKYDNSYLDLVSVIKGAVFSNINATIDPDFTESTVKVSWNGAVAPDGGTIINIVFNTIKSGKASIEIKNAELFDGDGNNINCNVVDSIIEITAATCENIEIEGPDLVDTATQYKAICTPSGVDEDIIKWGVDNPDIAIISKKGTLYPIKDGTVTISAATTDGTYVSATKTVVVDKVYCEKYMIDSTSAPSAAIIWCPEKAMGVDVIFASYDEGKLICSNVVSATLKEGSNVVYAGMDYTYNDCDNAKIFLWENVESTKPVCDFLSIDLIIDTDGDGLSDANEADLGTNPEKADTDFDRLTDYQETIIGTNPLKEDSDDNGISDFDEDCDEDGISNGDEYQQGTNPILYDTDADGLNDYEEINTYTTDPSLADTDDDGATDGWEVQNGTNPLVANDSFDISASSNEEDSAVMLTVSTSLSGEQANTLRIDTTNTLDYPLLTPDIPGYLDKAYDISVDGEIESATLSFAYDTSLGTVGEDFQPRVYYFNEEDGTLTELPNQTVVDGVVSVEVSHFSCYILLNKVEFDKVWDLEIKPPIIEDDGSAATLDISFVIDYSASMDDNDPQEIFKNLSKEFINKLRDGKDKASVVKFIRRATLVSELTTDKEQLNNAIDSISYDDGYGTYSGTDGSAGLKMALDELNSSESKYQYIVFITDGADNGYSYSYDDLIDSAVASNVVIYTIGMGSASENILKKISNETSGKYYHATTDFDSEDILDLNSVFQDIEDETIDKTTDSNKDGIPDYYNELIKSGDLVLTNGSAKFIGIDFNYNAYDKPSADYDGDGIKNGDELIIKYNSEDGKVYMSMYSDPMLKNSDGDMMDDREEKREGTNPLKDSISSGVTSYLRDDAGWYREYIVDLYDNDWMFRQEQNFFGWGLAGGFEDSATQWLIEYLYNYYDEDYIINMTNKYIQRTVHDTLNETFADVNKHIKDVKKAFDKTDEFYAAISDAVKYKKEANALLSRINALTPSNDAYGTYTKLINLLEGDYTKALENYAKLDESLLGSVDVKIYGIHENYRDVLDSTIGDTKLTGGKAFSYGLKAFSTAISISETVALFSKVNANTIAFEDNFDILCELRDNSKRAEIRAAAQTVINAMGKGYTSYATELTEACAEIVGKNLLEDLASKFLDKNPIIKGYEIAMAALKITGFDKVVKDCYKILCIDETIEACNTLFHQSVERVSGKYYFDSIEDTGDMMRYASHAAQLCYIGEKTYLSYLEGIWNGTKDSNYPYAKENFDNFRGGAEMYDIKIDYELE